jgi:hypothetical protein
LSSESGIYHLLIKQVSIVTSEFLQFRTRVRIRLNQAGIEWIVEQTSLFSSLLNRLGRSMGCITIIFSNFLKS